MFRVELLPAHHGDCIWIEYGPAEATSHILIAGGTGPTWDDELATRIAVTSLAKGEVLFQRGDDAEFFYFIDSGLVELSLISPTGDKKTLEVIGPGRTSGKPSLSCRVTSTR